MAVYKSGKPKADFEHWKCIFEQRSFTKKCSIEKDWGVEAIRIASVGCKGTIRPDIKDLFTISVKK